jgi:hypothetical protein
MCLCLDAVSTWSVTRVLQRCERFERLKRLEQLQEWVAPESPIEARRCRRYPLSIDSDGPTMLVSTGA